MKILFIGKPGSGKGSVTQRLEGDYIHFSTGNLLRQEMTTGSPEGEEIKALLDKGQFAPDAMIFKLVDKFLQENSDKNIVFDGFPRNAEQARACIEKGINFDLVFELESNDEILQERIVHRRVHLDSGRVYHLKSSPPKVEGVDDVTGEPLVHRKDDQPEILKERLRIYQEVTVPVLGVLKEANYNIIKVNANESIQTSLDEVNNAINNLQNKKKPKMR